MSQPKGIILSSIKEGSENLKPDLGTQDWNVTSADPLPDSADCGIYFWWWWVWGGEGKRGQEMGRESRVGGGHLHGPFTGLSDQGGGKMRDLHPLQGPY